MIKEALFHPRAIFYIKMLTIRDLERRVYQTLIKESSVPFKNKAFYLRMYLLLGIELRALHVRQKLH